MEQEGQADVRTSSELREEEERSQGSETARPGFLACVEAGRCGESESGEFQLLLLCALFGGAGGRSAGQKLVDHVLLNLIAEPIVATVIAASIQR